MSWDYATETLLKVESLSKSYGDRRAVDGVSVYVASKEIVGLLGPNGSGKTTTFKMMVGLIAPTSGNVFLGSNNITALPLHRRARLGIAYLPQDDSIFRKLTVEQNLFAILELARLDSRWQKARCKELLADFGLSALAANTAGTLSGGEKRRLAIARAMAIQPKFLLLDEPFSGVDPMAVYDIQQMFLTLREQGIGLLITDHNVRETLAVVDRAYLLSDGKILREGTSSFIINDPLSRELYLGPRYSI